MVYYIIENEQEYQVKLYFNKGGINYFTNKFEVKGFYLSVCPVKTTRTENGDLMSVEFVALSGIKTFIMEVERYSKVAEEKAIEIAEDKIQEMINYIEGKVQTKMKAI